jgi:hypothetical protein
MKGLVDEGSEPVLDWRGLELRMVLVNRVPLLEYDYRPLNTITFVFFGPHGSYERKLDFLIGEKFVARHE